MVVSVTSSGNTAQTDAFLNAILNTDLTGQLDSYAQRGVDALRHATPRDTGRTADSWTYEIVHEGGGVTIWWSNTNTQAGSFHPAIGLQYGHGTGTGGWVEGYDYINPALQPIFDQIAEAVWKEVQSA